MAYFIVNGILAVWLLLDGRKRQVNNLPLWLIGTLIFSVFVLPFYLAKRPLQKGETREGGTAWNVMRSFALLWTVLILAVGVQGCVGAITGADPTMTDAEIVGWTTGSAMGFGLLGCLWFVPMVGALVLGFFVRKSSVVEEGPTGPLASDE